MAWHPAGTSEAPPTFPKNFRPICENALSAALGWRPWKIHSHLSSPLGELINEEGEHLLAHGVGVCSHDEAIYTVIEWCSSYWVDFECGHISGPWCTLEAAMRNTPAGWLQPGGIHDVVAVSLQPRAIASMLVVVGGGKPRELTINGREWEV